VNNVGSKTLFSPVEQRARRFLPCNGNDAQRFGQRFFNDGCIKLLVIRFICFFSFFSFLSFLSLVKLILLALPTLAQTVQDVNRYVPFSAAGNIYLKARSLDK
jgi:hypothetical protein